MGLDSEDSITAIDSGFHCALFVAAFLPNPVYPVSPGKVAISEIAWMGTTVSANGEWIELYNNTAAVISLDGQRDL